VLAPEANKDCAKPTEMLTRSSIGPPMNALLAGVEHPIGHEAFEILEAALSNQMHPLVTGAI
jgi:hypothetical protein